MIDKILNNPIPRFIGYVMSISLGVGMTGLFGGGAGTIGGKLMGGLFILTGSLALVREIVGLIRGPQDHTPKP